jgi:hypothetical protein
MELLDICIVLLIRTLLSLWWSKVWTTLRLETQRVNTFNRAAMETGLEDWNPLMMTQRYAHHYPESLRDGVEVLDRNKPVSHYHSRLRWQGSGCG